MISQNQYLGGESHVLKHISAFCDENFVRESERRRGGEGEGGRGSIRGISVDTQSDAETRPS